MQTEKMGGGTVGPGNYRAPISPSCTGNAGLYRESTVMGRVYCALQGLVHACMQPHRFQQTDTIWNPT